MLFAKLLLTVHSIVTLVYGIALLIYPGAVAEYMGLVIATDDGQAELVTMYVGMSSILSLFMLHGVFNSKWLHSATLFLVLSITGIAIGRALSFAFLETENYTLNALVYDIPMAFLSWVAYLRLNKVSTT